MLGRGVSRQGSAGSTVTMRPRRTPTVRRATASSQIAVTVVAVEVDAEAAGVDAVAEAQLAAVDVADAGDHGLVHQQDPDRALSTG